MSFSTIERKFRGSALFQAPARWLCAGVLAAGLTGSAIPEHALAQAQPAVYQPPTGPRNQQARLANWQNELQPPQPGDLRPPQPDPRPQTRTPNPEPVPEIQPVPEAQPIPQQPRRPRSVLPNRGQRNNVQVAPPMEHQEYVDESLNGWMQNEGPACGPGCCGPVCNPCGPCGPRYCPPPGGFWNSPSPEDPCFQCRPPLWWAKADLLLGWRKGRSYPPLVTTDPANEDSTTAGVLPDATILYDGDTKNTQMQAGLNLDFGTFLDDCQTIGFGGRYFFFGADDGNFSRNSGQNAVLAIPFFSMDLNANSALLLAHPDVGGEVRSGSVAIRASNEIHGFDVYARLLYTRTATGRIDFITGWHTSSVNDNFQLRMQTDGNQANNDVRLLDQFNTENQFNGLILGVLTEHQVCCLTLRGKARVSVGNMHQSVLINGSTSVNGVVDPNQPGGLFTASSNIGNYSQDQFAAVTETGLSLGYYITPRTQLTVGYNLMYWSNIVRPGEQINTVVDDVNVPPTSPTFQFHTTSFWVQSLTLGLNCEF
ncbi:BBP7 family outer membrane beta-barrel protein [Anatilimnocola floriformis]|uniref:BBP7 family outer membrane beta-barrel protein n=1 Tax=Anatilimnocola floriformis TaxID=2948575 RepID=UPI0020C1E034|nr:BBP7 family outer membrane beta-barrel protein [Anatilimnocola floriformis]